MAGPELVTAADEEQEEAKTEEIDTNPPEATGDDLDWHQRQKNGAITINTKK